MSVDGRGQTTRYFYDAFNRPIRVVDPLGNEARRGYDAMGNVLWEALYGAGAVGGSPLPAYGYPSINDATLLAVTEYGYGLDGRQGTISRWHFDENHAWIADGHQDTWLTYDDVHRTVTITDDQGYSTVSQYDGAGRISSRTYPTAGDHE